MEQHPDWAKIVFFAGDYSVHTRTLPFSAIGTEDSSHGCTNEASNNTMCNGNGAKRKGNRGTGYASMQDPAVMESAVQH